MYNITTYNNITYCDIIHPSTYNNITYCNIIDIYLNL